MLDFRILRQTRRRWWIVAPHSTNRRGEQLPQRTRSHFPFDGTVRPECRILHAPTRCAGVSVRPRDDPQMPLSLWAISSAQGPVCFTIPVATIINQTCPVVRRGCVWGYAQQLRVRSVRLCGASLADGIDRVGAHCLARIYDNLNFHHRRVCVQHTA